MPDLAHSKWRRSSRPEHKMAAATLLALATFLSLSPNDVTANLNLYLTRDEVKVLLGLNSELYYVRAGVLNTYALGYTVKVPSNMSSLHFTWNSGAKRPMPYEAAVEYDNNDAMALPRLNITARGFVPTEPTTFRLSLPCSGRSSAEVLVSLHLNVTTRPNNRTAVTFYRKKICLQHTEAVPPGTDAHGSGGDGGERNDSVYLRRPQFAPSSLGIVYIAMGLAATITVLIVTLAAVFYLRVKRARDRSSVSSRFCSSPGYFGSNRPPASLRSNSYATIASCRHLTTTTKTVLVDNRNPLSYNFNFACVGKPENLCEGKNLATSEGVPEGTPCKKFNDSSASCGGGVNFLNQLDGSTAAKNNLNLAGRSCVSETLATKPKTDVAASNTCTSSSIAGIRNGTALGSCNNSPATVRGGISETKVPTSCCPTPQAGGGTSNLLGVCTTLTAGPGSGDMSNNGISLLGNSLGGSNSLHYASSPLSQVYSQPYYSPAHSWHPNSRLSLASSWGATLRSQLSWRENRRKDNKEIIKSLEVDRWRVVVGDMTHGGTFGRVHEGICRHPDSGVSQPVIVKTVSGVASTSQAQLVLHEGLLMAGLEHPHLLPVIGVCTASPHAPLLLYPHHTGAHNLKQYLLKSSSGSGGVSKLLTHDAVGLAIGVCKGLLYLHQHGLLHRDVATRNCLLDSELCVRVCDTALSRDLFPGDYHCLGDNDNRPVKWLPLEALQHNTYSTAADVWMFGVLVWELITLAQSPYVEVDPYEMAAYLRDGYRLAQPRSCPDDLFGVMAVCWAPLPEDRPPLQELLACLEAFLTTLTAFI